MRSRLWKLRFSQAAWCAPSISSVRHFPPDAVPNGGTYKDTAENCSENEKWVSSLGWEPKEHNPHSEEQPEGCSSCFHCHNFPQNTDALCPEYSAF